MPDGRMVDGVYRKPTLEEYPADYPHQIGIVERGSRGVVKRHRFARRFPKSEGTKRWRPETPGSMAELEELHRQGWGTRNKPMPADMWGSARQASLGIQPNHPLEPGVTIHLAQGLDVSSDALVIILDALASQARHQVDIADIKVVVSELGSYFRQIESLSPEQRQLAEQALYAEILKRCVNV